VGGGKAEAARGVVNLHGRLLRYRGLLLYGIGGVPRYREGEGQLAPGELLHLALKPFPVAFPRRLLTGHGVDVLLTHAPPPGPTAGEDFAHRGPPPSSSSTASSAPGSTSTATPL
jgi:hypothetical protein